MTEVTSSKFFKKSNLFKTFALLGGLAIAYYLGGLEKRNLPDISQSFVSYTIPLVDLSHPPVPNTATTFGQNGGFSNEAIADFDGDGDKEIAKIDWFGEIILSEFNASKKFHTTPKLVRPSAHVDSVSNYILFAQDVDEDGRPDLVSMNIEDSVLAFYNTSVDTNYQFSIGRVAATDISLRIENDSLRTFRDPKCPNSEEVMLHENGTSGSISVDRCNNNVYFTTWKPGLGPINRGLIHTLTEFSGSLYSADIDNDGDKDVVYIPIALSVNVSLNYLGFTKER